MSARWWLSPDWVDDADVLDWHVAALEVARHVGDSEALKEMDPRPPKRNRTGAQRLARMIAATAQLEPEPRHAHPSPPPRPWPAAPPPPQQQEVGGNSAYLHMMTQLDATLEPRKHGPRQVVGFLGGCPLTAPVGHEVMVAERLEGAQALGFAGVLELLDELGVEHGARLALHRAADWVVLGAPTEDALATEGLDAGCLR